MTLFNHMAHQLILIGNFCGKCETTLQDVRGFQCYCIKTCMHTVYAGEIW